MEGALLITLVPNSNKPFLGSAFPLGILLVLLPRYSQEIRPDCTFYLLNSFRYYLLNV